VAKITGNVNVLGNAVLRANGTISGDLDISGTVTYQTGRSQVTGAVNHPGAAAQAVLATQTFPVGTSPLTVSSGTTRAVATGNYAAGVIRARSNATFAAGTYDFASLAIEGDANVTLDTSGGPIAINVQGAVTIYSRARIVAGDPTKVTIYSNGTAVNIEPDVGFPGTLIAPAASVVIADRAVIGGCVGGAKVKIGTDGKVKGTGSITVPPTPPSDAGPVVPDAAPEPPDAEPDAAPEPPDAGSDATPEIPYTATASVKSWDTGYCAYVQVKNVSSAKISTWTVDLALNQSTITNNPWSAVFTANGPGKYVVTPLAWNAVLDPNGTADFGFCATKTGTNFTPSITAR
jgi:cellulase/cellobiase CelA1